MLSKLVWLVFATEHIYRRPGALYMTRFYFLSWLGRWAKDWLPLNVYLQHFHQSDEPIPHNHPRWFLSFILAGGYVESRVRPVGAQALRDIVIHLPGSANWIPRSRYHWVEVLNKYSGAWTLCFVGPSFGRSWGFWFKGNHVDSGTYKRNVLKRRNRQWRNVKGDPTRVGGGG